MIVSDKGVSGYFSDPSKRLRVTSQWGMESRLAYDGRLLAVTADGRPMEWLDFYYAMHELHYNTIAMVELAILNKTPVPWYNTTVTLWYIKSGRRRICKHCGRFAKAWEDDRAYYVECKCGRFESTESMKESVKRWRRIAKSMELFRQ